MVEKEATTISTRTTPQERTSPYLELRLEVPEEPTVAGLEGIHLGVGQTLRVQEVGSFRAKQSNVDPRSSTPEMDAHTRIGPFQSTYGTE